MKPILFNTEMVRAILNNSKTTTRRVIKPQPESCTNVANGVLAGVKADAPMYPDYGGRLIKYPYQKGDILYVRETFYQYGEWYDTMERVQIKGEWETVAKHTFVAKQGFPVYFKNTLPGNIEVKHVYKDGLGYYKRPSIFMPKEAARIFLRVTGVRAERLQDMENAPSGFNNPFCKEEVEYECDFIALWNRTIKRADLDKYGWDTNPWVWVYEFERCEKPKEGLI